MIASLRKVTFVGVGAIGMPMAQRIQRAGFPITVVDLSKARREQARALGMTAEAEPDSVATADSVIVMVATPDQLRTVAIGQGGLIDRMGAGSTLIVMSTVGPGPVCDVAAECARSDINMLDIPVTGGVARAETGELNLFASGSQDVIASQRELLASLGRVIECGEEVGTGQSFKAVNQLLCSVHIAAAAEGLALAERLGLDLGKVLPAIETGAAGSWMLSDRGPRMLKGLDVTVTSTIGIFVKDSTLVCDIADRIGFDAPMVRAAQSRYLAAREAGWVDCDDSQVIQTYRIKDGQVHGQEAEG
ncbi:NAD(P)-dependent oxidoreductase [Propionibacterium australiense]|uniref:6-phosphogluconate dehydrogenase C-terminal domain-like n=1 Tax=Propionibacterium australiense TaxID=119981 RepID=A0A383S8Q7_9ACTN|nr:NAD(P)-dependent oxidoreductase [Propionibacterium australiense]RLP09524.1 NAD(P)-dependent oxidoreductase [Propionibacterium australiense]RLP09896.1 NAD(P)-dependent oxidoreductase [Propionibacterium australiense]SYZ33804.1 6-phosphogluconate dehydrogenase C-terminal domain-like [Propionibacterium australiense]VEH91925.1 2-hydroxy-3-oxopropionate reductase [Propionibacterium australiense]